MDELLEEAVDIILFFYFRLVTVVFWVYNTIFEKKRVVSSPKNPLLFKSAILLGNLIRQRKLKSIEIVDAYIERIEEVNGLLNAITYKFFEEAREKANEIDNEIANMEDWQLAECANNRPFLGLPFTMKDSISCKGKILTVGMYSRRNAVAKENAVVVQRMFDAGAILLAITTVPETCMWVEVNTYLWGCTRNPYDSRRNVGGSSGGEGALHGAGASLMGIGSDIGGSVRIPSFMNGIFGFISSPGVVPLTGHVPGGNTGTYKTEMGRIGPMTRFAEDLSLINKVISGQRPNEIAIDERPPLDSLRYFYAEGPTHYKRVEPLSKEVKSALLKAVRHFEGKFDKVAQTISFPETKHTYDLYFSSYGEEGDPTAAQMLNDLEHPSQPVNCILELLKFPLGMSKYSLAGIIFALGTPFKTYTRQQRNFLNEERDRMKRRLEECLGNDGVLFYPCWPTLVQFHSETIFKQTSFMYPGLINVLGMPAVQCPIGLTNGLPNGVMIVANKGSEQALLQIAQEIEDAFGGWVPPGEN